VIWLALAGVVFGFLCREAFRAADRWILTRVVVSGSTFLQRWCSEAGASAHLEKLLARRRGHLTFNYPARWGGSYIQARHAANGEGWDVEYHICNPKSLVAALASDHAACQHWAMHEDNRERPVDADFVRSMFGHFLGGYEPPAPYLRDITYVLRNPPSVDDDDVAPPDAEPAGGVA
jgi:hypothetical protein